VPILEICRVLHSRGHIIEFACLDGCQGIATHYTFISKIHVIGRAVDPVQDEETSRGLEEADISTAEGRKGLLKCLMFFDSFWEATFNNLNKIICSSERPDFVFADLLDSSCVDMMNKWHIPLAVHYPQMPWMFVPQKYIPGFPGFQRKYLTSEHASLWDRIMEDLFAISLLFSMRHYGKWRAQMRKAAGAPPSALLRKPNYLVLVNSCFGLEVPKDLPPLMKAIGPVLSDEYAPLGDDASDFLNIHRKVIYVAFGSHVKLKAWRVKNMIQGIIAAINSGIIDGVLWALKMAGKEIEELGQNNETSATIDYEAIINNRHPHWQIMSWVPQRAILAHPSTHLFITHCGAASTNESAFHGVPMLALPFYGDQTANSRRAMAAGIALALDKNCFTASELHDKITVLTQDVNGMFARNVLRMQRIVGVTSKRKHLAADMIEEVLYDHELRFEHNPRDEDWKASSGVGKELRPMHLQTADSRMSWIKANNWDMWFVYASVVAVPYVLIKLAVKFYRS
jgi:UDP:flavonoid glycosyltransferase YjiC (YdhE family)